MRALWAFLPGDFEDALLYRGHLVALTTARTIRTYALDEVALELERRYPDAGRLPTIMLTRNDWLATESFRTLIWPPSVRNAFVTQFDAVPQAASEAYEIDATFAEYEAPRDGSVVLDMLLFNDRLYLCGDAGLFSADLDWTEQGTPYHDFRRRLDAPCVHATGGFGSVAVSCGSDGLFSAYDEFGYRRAPNGLTRIADRSVRAAWYWDDLLNYASYQEPAILHADFEEDEERLVEGERKLVTQMRPTFTALDPVYAALKRSAGIEKGDIEFAWNTRSWFFVSTFEGRMAEVQWRLDESDNVLIEHSRAIGDAPGRVLDAAVVPGMGFVLETERSVLLLARKKISALIEEEVLSVRSFPRSRRFKNVLQITTEAGIYLVGLFDELSLERRRKASDLVP